LVLVLVLWLEGWRRMLVKGNFFSFLFLFFIDSDYKFFSFPCNTTERIDIHEVAPPQTQNKHKTNTYIQTHKTNKHKTNTYKEQTNNYKTNSPKHSNKHKQRTNKQTQDERGRREKKQEKLFFLLLFSSLLFSSFLFSSLL